MDRVATEYGGDYEATAAALQASSDPVDQEAARGFVWFIERQRQQQEYQGWYVGVMAEQSEGSALVIDNLKLWVPSRARPL